MPIQDKNVLLLQVDELWLKGNNRPLYYKVLKNHILKVVKTYHNGPFTLLLEHHRFILTSTKSASINDSTMISSSSFGMLLLEALRKIPGLSSIVPCREIALDYEGAKEAAFSEALCYQESVASFRVTVKRSNKAFPHKSMDMARDFGGYILAKCPNLKVSIKDADLNITIRILDTHIYVSSKIYSGIGGLPVGPSGHLITLISGGLDSPVASFLMSKRGCCQDFVFFYSYPYVGEEVREKIFHIVQQLVHYQVSTNLYIFPFGRIQKELSEKCHSEYRTVFFRKCMIDVAALLAEKLGAQALLTGDSLGQVSSQTIGNICLLDSLSSYPIFRPLLGMNKSEIIKISREIGLFELSTLPHDDACSLFAPTHPITNPKVSYVKDFFNQHDFSTSYEDGFEKMQTISLSLSGEIQNRRVGI